MFLSLAAALAAAVLSSLCVGAVRLPLCEIAAALLGKQTVAVSTRIVLYTRLPRLCASLLAGAALAVSGAVIQIVLDNPLAAPNIIGVNAGAGLAVTAAGAFWPGCALFLPLSAFAGAMAAVGLLLLLSEATGASRLTTVLAGVSLSSLFGATIDTIVTLVPDALNSYSDFKIGGFSHVTMARLLPAAWGIAAAGAAVFALSQGLEILSLGAETARSLGLPVRQVRAAALLCAAALAGCAVSFAGLLGFVGLIVPHILRRFVGMHCQALLLGSAMGGALLVCVCDLIARTLFSPYELSVGIVLAFVGVPFFLYLLFRQRKGRIHD